jgi:transcriptional regulator with XRE-family HTH domain
MSQFPALPRRTRPRVADLGTRLRARAQALGFTSADVARAAGLAEGTYRHYIAGRREPPNADLVAIAYVLQTSTDELLGIDPSLTNHFDRQTYIAYRDLTVNVKGLGAQKMRLLSGIACVFESEEDRERQDDALMPGGTAQSQYIRVHERLIPAIFRQLQCDIRETRGQVFENFRWVEIFLAVGRRRAGGADWDKNSLVHALRTIAHDTLVMQRPDEELVVAAAPRKGNYFEAEVHIRLGRNIKIWDDAVPEKEASASRRRSRPNATK